MSNEYYEIGAVFLLIALLAQSARAWYLRYDRDTIRKYLNQEIDANRGKSGKIDRQIHTIDLLRTNIKKLRSDLAAANSLNHSAEQALNDCQIKYFGLKSKLKAFEQTELLMKAPPVVIHTENIPLMGVSLELSPYETKVYTEEQINGMIADKIAESLGQFIKPLIYVNHEDYKTKVEAKFYFKQLEQ